MRFGNVMNHEEIEQVLEYQHGVAVSNSREIAGIARHLRVLWLLAAASLVLSVLANFR